MFDNKQLQQHYSESRSWQQQKKPKNTIFPWIWKGSFKQSWSYERHSTFDEKFSVPKLNNNKYSMWIPITKWWWTKCNCKHVTIISLSDTTNSNIYKQHTQHIPNTAKSNNVNLSHMHTQTTPTLYQHVCIS